MTPTWPPCPAGDPLYDAFCRTSDEYEAASAAYDGVPDDRLADALDAYVPAALAWIQHKWACPTCGQAFKREREG